MHAYTRHPRRVQSIRSPARLPYTHTATPRLTNDRTSSYIYINKYIVDNVLCVYVQCNIHISYIIPLQCSSRCSCNPTGLDPRFNGYSIVCVCVCFILHSVYIFIIINLKRKKGALAGWFTCIAWFGLETQVAALGIIISPLEATSTADWPNMHTKSVSLMRYALTKDCTTTFVNMQWMTAIIFKFVHNKTRGSDLAHEWYFLLSPALFSN